MSNIQTLFGGSNPSPPPSEKPKSEEILFIERLRAAQELIRDFGVRFGERRGGVIVLIPQYSVCGRVFDLLEIVHMRNYPWEVLRYGN